MEKSSIVRIAQKAGSWYESNAKKLESELLDYLHIAKQKISENILKGNLNIKGMIVPHAGYYYSGQTAAYSYLNFISDTMVKNLKNVVVLGPSHHKYFKGCKVSVCNEIETPFGNLNVNTEICKQLLTQKGFSKLDKEDDENEHSLEMQYPYLFQTLYKFNCTPQIIPIMVGEIDMETSDYFGKILSILLERDDTVFVISSDFCHWGKNFGYSPYSGDQEIFKYIERLDHEGIDHIKKLDLKGFNAYLSITNNTICGRNPIMLFLSTISNSKFSQKTNVELLYYTQSSQVKKHSQSSVSYSSILFHI